MIPDTFNIYNASLPYGYVDDGLNKLSLKMPFDIQSKYTVYLQSVFEDVVLDTLCF